jgi:hypothetical protein
MINNLFREINHRPFGHLQNEVTLHKYHSFCLQVVCFILRYLALDQPPIPVKFTPLQQQCASHLQDAVDRPNGYSDEMWEDAIHSLLASLFFHKHAAASHHADKDPIHMALILMNINVNDGGNFNSCSWIAAKLSGLLHIMRLVAVKEIRIQADGREEEEEDAEFE